MINLADGDSVQNSVSGPEESRPIVKEPVEARQGRMDRPVLYVLVISLALAIIAYLILHFYFF